MKKLLFIAVLFSLSFTACQKEEGPAGPIGPQGPQGPQGNNGNANVHSATFIVNPGDWAYNAPSYYVTLSYPQITQDIINTGAVLVYLQNNPGNYSQLPLTFYPSNTYSETFEISSGLSNVKIFRTDSDLTDPGPVSNALTFKVVVIASSGKKANPNLDLKDYSKVKEAFNLSE